jgi:hypothetical protein
VRTIGRLIEVRVSRLTSVADVESVHAEILRAIGPPSASDRVLCVDCRSAAALPPGAVDSMSRGMREVNPRIERSAVLVAASNTMFSLQAERAVRCAGNSERHVFSDVDELLEWLDDGLTEVERSELRIFLSRADA